MIRSLLSVVATLPPLPVKRFLTMQLRYRNDVRATQTHAACAPRSSLAHVAQVTPADYEPRFFRPATEADACALAPATGGAAAAPVFVVPCGTVATRHHTLSVAVQGFEQGTLLRNADSPLLLTPLWRLQTWPPPRTNRSERLPWRLLCAAPLSVVATAAAFRSRAGPRGARERRRHRGSPRGQQQAARGPVDCGDTVGRGVSGGRDRGARRRFR